MLGCVNVLPSYRHHEVIHLLSQRLHRGRGDFRRDGDSVSTGIQRFLFLMVSITR